MPKQKPGLTIYLGPPKQNAAEDGNEAVKSSSDSYDTDSGLPSPDDVDVKASPPQHFARQVEDHYAKDLMETVQHQSTLKSTKNGRWCNRLPLLASQSAVPKKQLISQAVQDNIYPEDIVVLGELGRGSGGTVNKVLHRGSGILMASKVLNVTVKASTRDQIMKELKILTHCESPFIVKFFGSYYIRGEVHILMEYMEEGSLEMFSKAGLRIPETALSRIALQVLKGMKYLKANHDIIHRDIKPSNMLMNSSGQVKLCDFGVSKDLEASQAETFVGTLSYLAPERLHGLPYGIASDIWSFGLSMMELAIGRYPIPCPTPQQFRRLLTADSLLQDARDPSECSSLSYFDLLLHITQCPSPSFPPDAVSRAFKNFTDSCLAKDPNKRLSLEQLLNHAFCVGTNDVLAWLKMLKSDTLRMTTSL